MKNIRLQSLATRQAGSGQALLLLPGLAGLARFWDPVAEILADRFHVIAIDHPGVGASPSPAAEHSIEGIATAVLALLDEMGLDKCAVVGHSTGGLVAQSLALDAAPRIDKIVLSSTWAQSDRRFQDLFRLRQLVLSNSGATAYALLGQLLAYPADWYEKHLSGATTLQRDAVEPSVVMQRIDMLLTHDRSQEIDRIAHPTLVVGAHDDNIVPFHHSVELAQRVRGARLQELSGGHFTPTTRTSAYANLVRAFLGEAP